MKGQIPEEAFTTGCCSVAPGFCLCLHDTLFPGLCHYCQVHGRWLWKELPCVSKAKGQICTSSSQLPKLFGGLGSAGRPLPAASKRTRNYDGPQIDSKRPELTKVKGTCPCFSGFLVSRGPLGAPPAGHLTSRTASFLIKIYNYRFPNGSCIISSLL